MCGNSKIFQIKLKALSPISITKREFGILYETYHFIPAWTMWNSLVKLYAIKDESIDYKKAKKVFENIRLSNFYIFENNDVLMDLPNKKKRVYIDSDLKNAIDVLTNTSLDKALYEREYIKAGKEFIGWVKTTTEEVHNFIKELKGKVFFVGADKNKGFGKVKFEDVKQENFCNGRKSKVIIDKLKNSKNAGAIFPVEKDINEVFPLVLREWDTEKGSGFSVIFYDKEK